MNRARDVLPALREPGVMWRAGTMGEGWREEDAVQCDSLSYEGNLECCGSQKEEHAFRLGEGMGYLEKLPIGP